MTHAQPPVTVDNETGECFDESQEQNLIKDVFDNERNAENSAQLINSFITSYSQHKNSLALDVWLDQEFSKYPNIWENEQERRDTVIIIIQQIQQNNAAKTDLYAHLDKGKSRESWLAKKIEQGASSAGVVNVGQYAHSIDEAIKTANQQNWNVITNQNGTISQSLNLDGFIAEHHHANTFNIDAAAKGSSYRAEVLEPKAGETYGKNSVDIVIKDGDGKIVRRYQAKYGKDEKATEQLFEKGDYRGQRKLVPEGQNIENASEVIEIDGVSSKSLSKEQAKALQEQAQIDAEIKQYDWNDANRMAIAKEIGKAAAVSAAFSAGLQGVRILGRRIWNNLTGKENPTANEDLQEFFQSSIKSSANTGVQVAVSGALMVAVRNGWIKALQNTPAGMIANIAYVGLENAKCLVKLAKGELNTTEALNAMGNVSCTAIGGIAGSMLLGAKIGALTANPVGMAIGGFVGAVAGGIAGSAIGDAVYQGGKAIVETATKTVKSVYEGAKSVAKKALNTLTFGILG